MIQRFSITDSTVASGSDSVFKLDDNSVNPKYSAENVNPEPLGDETERPFCLNGGLITVGTIAVTGVVIAEVGLTHTDGSNFAPVLSVVVPLNGGVVPLDFKGTGRPQLLFTTTFTKLAINLRAVTADIAGVNASGFFDIVPE